MNQRAWNVYAPREADEFYDPSLLYPDDGLGDYIDTVFFDKDCNSQYVRRSLIDHDGYDSDIKVRMAAKIYY